MSAAAGGSRAPGELGTHLALTSQVIGPLGQEFRVIAHCVESADFAEGIRAQVIDKDRNPRWAPATLSEVSQDRVDWFFTEQDPAAGRYTL